FDPAGVFPADSPHELALPESVVGVTHFPRPAVPGLAYAPVVLTKHLDALPPPPGIPHFFFREPLIGKKNELPRAAGLERPPEQVHHRLAYAPGRTPVIRIPDNGRVKPAEFLGQHLHLGSLNHPGNIVK